MNFSNFYVFHLERYNEILKKCSEQNFPFLRLLHDRKIQSYNLYPIRERIYAPLESQYSRKLDFCALDLSVHGKHFKHHGTLVYR